MSLAMYTTLFPTWQAIPLFKVQCLRRHTIRNVSIIIIIIIIIIVTVFANMNIIIIIIIIIIVIVTVLLICEARFAAKHFQFFTAIFIKELHIP